ncbi:superinfection immunity protein [Acidithiobacillus thiooxidans]|uniref:superinfection immunity protein n=1 Tax=Acidithiobacillus thiooxidans TaxID=930 RepID=UPI001C06CD50|nr:superinfection immunity protein [Acidithiobacillus thiooxidans]MBU2840299.1 superinfection immunity protein [Acidithiobacillus thiooxidans]MBU2844135.1 superinfection immunity protein [Acidithiobacillus thiooxidans]
MTALILTIGLIFALFIYFIPTIIAIRRKKSNLAAIMVLNIFLGWSLVGWVISLVWALSMDAQPQTIIVNNHNGKTD